MAAAAAIALLSAAAHFWLRSEYAGGVLSKLLSGYSGRDVSVRNVSGSLVKGATLNGLKISSSGGAAFKRFTAERLNAAYSLLQMARNQKPGLASCEFGNARLELCGNPFYGGLSPAAAIEAVKSAAARIFYNGSVPFYVGKISASNFTVALDGFKEAAGDVLLRMSALKITPRNIFMSSYYFETLVEMLHDGTMIIPSCGIKGEIDFNSMTFRVYFDAGRVRLSDFSWMLDRASPGLRIDDGMLFASAVINYSQQDGLTAFGNAVIKNLAISSPAGGHKFSGELVNVNFNEDSFKIVRSKVAIDDFPFTADGTIADVFSRNSMKADLTLRAEGAPAEKALAAIRKSFGYDAAGAYYATGAVDADFRVSGTGTDLSRWKTKTSVTLRNVDIASQKISLAFERINGRVEGENGSLKNFAPLTMKAGGRWHQLSAEVKNACDESKLAYNISFKEYFPPSASETVTIEEDEAHFIVFDYDENDDEWGGWNNENPPSATFHISMSRNARGRYASGTAVFRDISIDGLFGLRRAKAGATMTLRAGGAHFGGLTVSGPGGEYDGELRIAFGAPARYELRLQPSPSRTSGGVPGGTVSARGTAIKLSGVLKSFGEDLQTIFKYDTASDPAAGDATMKM